ncbi:hypothetical protein LX36DRAFT_73664 [Colletotrichum falcatum]|nr:hypothetical protein LX36DRAFT_73664 [Colletotrichum falcatum]
MRPTLHSGLFLVTVCTATATSLAEPRAASPSILLGNTPKCSVPCFIDLLRTAGCDNKSFGRCICLNTSLQAHASKCIQTSCSFEDQILTARISQEFCHGYPIDEHRRDFCRVFLVALPAITASIVLLRFIARKIGRIPLWWDDWTALVAVFFLILTLGCGVANVQLGFGLHYWNVRPGNGKPILLLFYVTQVFYVIKQVTAKVSICTIYLRVFVARWSRMTVIGLMVSLVIQHFLFLFLVVFQCTPIQSIWDRYIPGSCLNLRAIAYAGGALTITYDCILMLLPLPQLLKLNVSVRKRLVLIFLLALGSFACVASMVRLKFLVSFSNTFDPTWDNVETLVWSTLEINLAMICGSLPALRPLFIRVQEAMGSLSNRTHNGSVAECGNQTSLSDIGQSRASSKFHVLPDSPRKLEELGCDVSPSGTHDEALSFHPPNSPLGNTNRRTDIVPSTHTTHHVQHTRDILP